MTSEELKRAAGLLQNIEAIEEKISALRAFAKFDKKHFTFTVELSPTQAIKFRGGSEIVEGITSQLETAIIQHREELARLGVTIK